MIGSKSSKLHIQHLVLMFILLFDLGTLMINKVSDDKIKLVLVTKNALTENRIIQ